MPEYTVNILTIVDVRLRKIIADSPHEAVLKAEAMVDFDKTIGRRMVILRDGTVQVPEIPGMDEVWWAEGHHAAIVDDSAKEGQDGTFFDRPEDGWKEMVRP